MAQRKRLRYVALFALLGVVAIAGAWYVVFWKSETAHLSAERQSLVTAQGNVTTLQAKLADMIALQKKLPAERVALARLDRAVPDGPSVDQLLVTITNAAAKAGVKLTSIGTPEPSDWGAGATTSSTGPQSISLSVNVNGTNSGFMRFVTALDSEPRLFVVENLDLQSPPGAARASEASTSFTVEAFYVSASPPDPASPPATHRG